MAEEAGTNGEEDTTTSLMAHMYATTRASAISSGGIVHNVVKALASSNTTEPTHVPNYGLFVQQWYTIVIASVCTLLAVVITGHQVRVNYGRTCIPIIMTPGKTPTQTGSVIEALMKDIVLTLFKVALKKQPQNIDFFSVRACVVIGQHCGSRKNMRLCAHTRVRTHTLHQYVGRVMYSRVHMC
jgi:hypothetical protein